MTLPHPEDDPRFWEHVPPKRFLAWLVDLAVTLLVVLVLVFLSAGLALFLLPIVWSAVAVTYRGLMLGRYGATLGMLLVALRLHGFGFVGSPVVTPIIRAAMPNKLFEYISQGVVPICWNTDEAGEFVTKHGIGFHLHGDLVNLRDQLKDGYKVREKMIRLRREFAMESQAEKLENFYQSLI